MNELVADCEILLSTLDVNSLEAFFVLGLCARGGISHFQQTVLLLPCFYQKNARDNR